MPYAVICRSYTGYCFQFNGNGSMNATAAGKTGGVEFTLNTHVDQYSAGPNSASEGFSVIYILYDTIQHYIILHNTI